MYLITYNVIDSSEGDRRVLLNKENMLDNITSYKVSIGKHVNHSGIGNDMNAKVFLFIHISFGCRTYIDGLKTPELYKV